MSLLSHDELVRLTNEGVITLNGKPVPKEFINGTSIDIHLGEMINYEGTYLGRLRPHVTRSIKNRDHLALMEHSLIKDKVYTLKPNEFILAHSQEIFNLPNDITAEYKLKSSGARLGLNHSLAGWCDPGWHDSSLTLELKNITRYHYIELNYMDLIGQMIFYRVNSVAKENSYETRGRYNGDKSVSGVKK